MLAILREIVESDGEFDETYQLFDANLLMGALYHDAVESVTGDTPAPVKWRHPRLEEALREAEASIGMEFDLLTTLTTKQKRLIKYADYMELVMFSLEEYDTGNKTMATVARNAINAIKGRELTDITPSALRLYDLMAVRVESLPKEETLHGWPDYG